MAATLAPTVNKAQQAHRLDVASSSNDSRIRYNVHLVLPHGREEELLRDAEAREKWYHSFISGGERTGEGEDKDPRIQHPWKVGRLVGFSALLTREEALALKEYKGFYCARPSIAYPSPSSYPRRPEKETKNSSLVWELDLEEYICASDEMKEQMMAVPRQREKMRMEMLSQLNTSPQPAM